MVSYGGLGALRDLGATDQLDVVPCHYSALPRMFAERRLPCDAGLLQVSPPDADGMCSLGIGVDYMADALEHTPLLFAEINTAMPAVPGSPRIPLDRFAATMRTDRPLQEGEPPGDVDSASRRRSPNSSTTATPPGRHRLDRHRGVRGAVRARPTSVCTPA